MSRTSYEDDAKELARRGYADPVFFGRFFQPEVFAKDICWLHRGWLAILTRQTDFLLKYGELDKIVENFRFHERPGDLDSPLLPMFEVEYGPDDIPVSISMVISDNTLLIVPRGFAKTTILLLYILWGLSYREITFPLFVSETMGHAQTQVINLRRVFEENQRHRAVFGNLVPGKQDGLAWRDDYIQLLNGTRVMAKGRGGQVRGLLVDAERPDLVAMDDVENEESVLTEEQREKTRKWAYQALFPVLGHVNVRGRIIAAGTLLHPEALLMYLARDPSWTTLKFSALDSQGESIWPEVVTPARLEIIKQRYALAGMLSGFYLEYMSQVRNDETAKFRQEMFKYGQPPEGSVVATALALDPAFSEKRRADFAAFAVVSVTQQGVLYIREVYMARGMSPREMVDRYFELARAFQVTHAGVESVAAQVTLVNTITEEMFRKGYFFPNGVDKIYHSTQKEVRVEGTLAPRYASGYIVHCRRFPEYESQLLDWPRGKKDGPDAVAMAISLLGSFAATASPESMDLAANAYRPLLEEFGGDDWRSY